MPAKNDVILSLNQEAQERKAKGIPVLNGSIGMMYLDDGSLPVSAGIRAILGRHTADEDLSYSSVAGTSSYHEGLRRWFLGTSFDQEAAQHGFSVVATPGGTGAVTLAFSLERLHHGALILPSLDWPNYEGIAGGFGISVAYYSLFDGDAFNLKSLQESLATTIQKAGHVSLVINDPCHNPTGYCLSPEEWASIAGILSKEEFAGKCTLIVDVAYIDFADAEHREGLLKAIKSLPAEDLVCLAFSFSKTFSFYGLRIGGLGLYGKDPTLVANAKDASLMEARALWSVPNHMAMNAVSELLSTPLATLALRQEVESNRLIVAKRADIYFREAAEVGLANFPYRSGFFVTLPMKDAYKTALILKDKNIFLAPIRPDALRIALCAIPTPKMTGLAQAISLASK